MPMQEKNNTQEVPDKTQEVLDIWFSEIRPLYAADESAVVARLMKARHEEKEKDRS